MSIGDKSIIAGTVIWTAGVKVHKIKIVADKMLEKDEGSGRIKTNRNLSIPSYENVLVCGDFGWVPHRDDATRAYPMRAQFAVRQGPCVAKNIAYMVNGNTKGSSFHIEDKGFIISLGRGGALARVFGIHISGFLAWWIYRTAYLGKIFGIRAKLRTVLEWTLNLFLPRDLSEL